MRREAIITSLQFERQRRPRRAEGLIHVRPDETTGRIQRTNIVAISGVVAEREIAPSQAAGYVIEFPKRRNTESSVIAQVKREQNYNPNNRSKQYIDETGRTIIRLRRISRCVTMGDHPPEECPSGPRHRPRARIKLRLVSAGQPMKDSDKNKIGRRVSFRKPKRLEKTKNNPPEVKPLAA